MCFFLSFSLGIYSLGDLSSRHFSDTQRRNWTLCLCATRHSIQVQVQYGNRRLQISLYRSPNKIHRLAAVAGRQSPEMELKQLLPRLLHGLPTEMACWRKVRVARSTQIVNTRFPVLLRPPDWNMLEVAAAGLFTASMERPSAAATLAPAGQEEDETDKKAGVSTTPEVPVLSIARTARSSTLQTCVDRRSVLQRM